MSNLFQSMTDEEWDELSRRKPLIMTITLNFTTAKKLNKRLKTQKEIEDFVEKAIDFFDYLPFENDKPTI